MVVCVARQTRLPAVDCEINIISEDRALSVFIFLLFIFAPSQEESFQ